MNLHINTTVVPSNSGVEYADPIVEPKEEDDDVFWFELGRVDSKLPKVDAFGFRNFEEIGKTKQEFVWNEEIDAVLETARASIASAIITRKAKPITALPADFVFFQKSTDAEMAAAEIQWSAEDAQAMIDDEAYWEQQDRELQVMLDAPMKNKKIHSRGYRKEQRTLRCNAN